MQFRQPCCKLVARGPTSFHSQTDICKKKRKTDPNNQIPRNVPCTSSVWFPQRFQIFSIDIQKFFRPQSEIDKYFFCKDRFSSQISSGELNCRFDKPAETFSPKRTEFFAHCLEVIKKLHQTPIFVLKTQTDRTNVIFAETVVFVNAPPKLRRNHFWKSRRRFSARSTKSIGKTSIQKMKIPS